MEQFAVSRDPGVYEAFPDVARTPDGRLVCVFAECTHHGDRAYTRLVYAVSEDRGRTWSEKRPLSEPRYGDAESYWNCPRVSALPDGRLVAVADRVAGDPPDREEASVWLWTSADGGESWDGPRQTPVTGIVPDQVVELAASEHAGRWVLSAHHVADAPDGPLWHERTWLSDDEGDTWAGPHTVAAVEDLKLCEGSVLELPDGDLVCFMRENSGTGPDCYTAVSEDGGRTWDGVARLPLPACHRPVAGMLDSGDVLITHRFMQGGAGWLGSWTQNAFAAFTDPESCRARDRSGAATRIVPLDYDRSSAADTGYTGWVQFPDGEIYVVNYVVDDAPATRARKPPDYDGEYAVAPRAQIRGYAFHQRDVVLDPPADGT